MELIHAPIKLPGARKILVVGDPGEMDASQYVLVRELAATEADVLLLMSDVVYPAGNIDAWSDAVYLPYLGRPKARWDDAMAKLPDEAHFKLPDWQVIATPGNHDWYDGLMGWMFHVCGAEPLPSVSYRSGGIGLRGRLARRFWQAPAPWNRERLHPLRRSVGPLGTGADVGPMPNQPGPYFTVEVGGDGVGKPQLVLICVDTGIDGSIDVEQAAWLEEQVAEPEVSKIVVTGKPLVHDDKVNDLPIDLGDKPPGFPHESDRDLPPPENGSAAIDPRPRSVREIVADGQRIIACLAGDIHNAQRVVLSETAVSSPPDNGDAPSLEIGPDQTADGVPPVAFVAGGGGAYLSATHKIPLDEAGRLHLRHGRAPQDALPADRHVTPPRIPAGNHWRFPSRERSVLRASTRMGVIWGLVLLAMGVALVGLAGLLSDLILHGSPPTHVKVEGGKVSMFRAVAGPFITILIVVLSVLYVRRLPRPRKWWGWLRPALLPRLVPLLAAAAVLIAVWDVDLRGGAIMGVATVSVLFLPVVLVFLPQLRAVSEVARFLPVKSLSAAAGGVLSGTVLGELTGAKAWAVAFAAAAGAGLAYLLVRFSAHLVEHSELQASNRNPGWQRAVAIVLTIGLSICAVIGPWIVAGFWASNGAVHAGRMLAVSTGVILLLIGTGFAVVAMRNARRTLPQALWVAMAVAAAVGGFMVVAAGIGWVDLLDWVGADAWAWWTTIPVAFILAYSTAVVVLAGALIWGASSQPSWSAITQALASRDGHSGVKPPRDLNLFHAMTIAAVPGISEIAEATQPPFHKSFMTITVQKDRGDGGDVVVETFAVDDERTSEQQGPAPAKPPTEEQQFEATGAYKVDSVRFLGAAATSGR